MTSETVILNNMPTKEGSLISWLESLTEFFQSKGFTVAEGDGFGIVDNEIMFGVKCTENTGALVYSTPYSSNYSSDIAVGTYKIVDGVVSINENLSTPGYRIDLTDSTTHALVVNYHVDSNNAYFDVQLDTNFGAGYLITKFDDYVESDISDKCLLSMVSSGYRSVLITPNRYYGSTANGTLKALPNLKLPSGRYTSYTTRVCSSDSSVIYGITPNLIGICGDFTHAYAQEISVDGKNYFHLGNHIYMPL